MPYNPGVQSRVGELLGAGISQFGAGIGAGLEARAQRNEQEKQDAQLAKAFRVILPTLKDDNGQPLVSADAAQTMSGRAMGQLLQSYSVAQAVRAQQAATKQSGDWFKLQQNMQAEAEARRVEQESQDKRTGRIMSQFATAANPPALPEGYQGAPVPPVVAFSNAFQDAMRSSTGLGAGSVAALAQFAHSLAPAPVVEDRTGQVQDVDGSKILWTSPRSAMPLPQVPLKNGLPLVVEPIFNADGSESDWEMIDGKPHLKRAVPDYSGIETDKQGNVTQKGANDAFAARIYGIIAGRPLPKSRTAAASNLPAFVWDPAHGLVPYNTTNNPAR